MHTFFLNMYSFLINKRRTQIKLKIKKDILCLLGNEV